MAVLPSPLQGLHRDLATLMPDTKIIITPRNKGFIDMKKERGVMDDRLERPIY
jgi:hypothetical protein